MRPWVLLMIGMMGAGGGRAGVRGVAPALVAGTITAEPGDTQVVVTLAVAPAGGSGALTTTLYRLTGTGGSIESATSLGTIAAGSPVTDTGRTNGVTYYYKARTVDAASSTADSAEINETPEGAGGVEPILDLDFESYADTAALMADSSTFTLSEDNESGTGQSGAVADIVLDTSPPAGSGGTKAMRYDFNHGVAPGGCQSITIGRQAAFPGGALQEVWIEMLMRYTPNFSTANSGCAPNDHKLVFIGTVADESGRIAFYVGADSPPFHSIQFERCADPSLPSPHLPGAEYPTDDGGMVAEDLWEADTWHTFRLHFKCSTTTSSGDGIYEGWVNGVRIHNQTGFNTSKGTNGNTTPERMDNVSWCHNKDDGPVSTLMQLWTKRVRVYNQDPGW